MPDHITEYDLEQAMEAFLHENPCGDSRDLARHMFNLGFEAGERGEY